jgi:hypothetical protein
MSILRHKNKRSAGIKQDKKVKSLKSQAFYVTAEGEGFEPPDPAKDQRFSRPPHSTALPSLSKIEWANIALNVRSLKSP